METPRRGDRDHVEVLGREHLRVVVIAMRVRHAPSVAQFGDQRLVHVGDGTQLDNLGVAERLGVVPPDSTESDDASPVRHFLHRHEARP